MALLLAHLGQTAKYFGAHLVTDKARKKLRVERYIALRRYGFYASELRGFCGV